MAEEAHHELIIVRRHEEEEHAAHSSAWKVAHADFMTAMMAFFLIMWLINVTDDKVRKGISQYFNPIHLSEGSTDLKGLNPPDPSSAGKAGKKGPNDSAPTPLNPVQLNAAAAPPAAAPPADAAAKGITQAQGADAAAGSGPAATTAQGAMPTSGGAPRSGGYQDPYAVLSKIPGDTANTDAVSPDSVTGDPRALGPSGGAISRDPFDPTYWQLTQAPAARSATPGAAGTADKPPAGATPDAAAAAAVVPPAAAPLAAAAPQPAAAPVAPPPQPASATPAVTSPPSDGVAAPADADAAPRAVSVAKAIADQVVKTAPAALAGAAPDLTVKATSEGTLMRLTDDALYSMFPVGSAKPDAKVVAVLNSLAQALSSETGAVIIRGYTDARPFHSADNDNWRLSVARARAAYDLLVHAGLDEKRVVAIEGHADRDLLNTADPYAAENRRIEILLKVGE